MGISRSLNHSCIIATFIYSDKHCLPTRENLKLCGCYAENLVKQNVSLQIDTGTFECALNPQLTMLLCVPKNTI